MRPPPPPWPSAVPPKPQVPPARIIREGDVGDAFGQFAIALVIFVFLAVVTVAVQRSDTVEPAPCASTVRTCTRTDVGPVGAPYWIVECVEE